MQAESRYGFSAPEFVESVLRSFPDIGAELDGGDDVHYVMSLLDRAIVEAARGADFARAHAILVFVDSILDQADLDPEIPNAVSISFIEPAVLDDMEGGRQVWREAPRRVRSLVLENKNRSATSWE